MNVISIGVDTETKRGKPISFQFYSEEIKLEKIIWIRNPANATEKFFSFLDSLPNVRDRHFVCFGHNLSFDMVSFFYDKRELLRDESIEAVWYGWRVKIVYAAVRFAEFRKGRKTVLMIDTGAYFAGRKLLTLAEIFCPHLPKLPMPKGLGQKSFSAKDKKFCAYAMRDSEIAWFVGQNIIKQHEKWDISLAVSAPHFASKVFRRHFMKDIIPLPPRKVVYAALNAYHGGKNNLTVEKGIYKNVYLLDIKSAYPFAMSRFPSFSNPDLYKGLEGEGTPQSLPEFGIYKITGTVKACKWPILYDHRFKPIQGDFKGVWVTGFELNEALRMREVELETTTGYYYEAEKDKRDSPFKGYAEHFFNAKETAANKTEKEFNKLLLNSLYGKFIQTRAANTLHNIVHDMDSGATLFDSSIVAGGLFNPFIAALITGHCRAYIHKLEHKYKALHTSTDGIQTQIKPRESDLGKHLGAVTMEVSGDVLIFRNKLYIVYSDIRRGDRDILRSTIFPRKKISKFALHGFHKDVATLEHLYKSGTNEYEYTRVNKLKESIRRKLQVNDFVTTKAVLNY